MIRSHLSVEADIAEGGLPVFEMVGFLGSEIKESKDRIRTSFQRIVTHLNHESSPAEISSAGLSILKAHSELHLQDIRGGADLFNAAC